MSGTKQTARILVVDDEENLRNILVFQLRGEGYEARGLGRGDETLSAALHWKPDLVLLDLMMPGMDGFAVCRALRGNPATAGTPTIVVTARGDAATKLQALRDVGAEYVLLNCPGGLPSLRRFAHEVMPAFAGPPMLQTAV